MAVVDSVPPNPPSTTQKVEPLTPVNGPAAWFADELGQHPEQWTFKLTPEHISELEGAIKAAEATGKDIKDITLDDVFLPTLGPLLVAFRDEVVHGRGFQLITGFPVDRWSRKQSVTGYWILGLHWGKALSNNYKGHLVGHVKDLGLDLKKAETRLYATSAAQPYHTDGADIVTLLCLKEARVGGKSRWASSWALHNEFLKLRPDLGPIMAGPWYIDRKGEVPTGQKPYFALPPFNYHEGYLSVNWAPHFYESVHRHEGVPPFSKEHEEAFKLFNELAASPRFTISYELQPGDIQLLSNHSVVHARDSFIDDAEKPEDRRHLLRLWIAPPNERPLPESYSFALGGSVEVGNRGGIVVEGVKLNVPLEAE